MAFVLTAFPVVERFMINVKLFVVAPSGIPCPISEKINDSEDAPAAKVTEATKKQ
jgi:hypothetical protein